MSNKINQYTNPFAQLFIAYGNQKGKFYSESNDRFLLCMLQQVGYGNWEALKHEVHKSKEFAFDWYFKSRTPSEIQRRCDMLIRLIEKEAEGTNLKIRKRQHNDQSNPRIQLSDRKKIKI